MAFVFPVHVRACGVVFVRACGALAMPAGTRPGRVLELIAVTMAGNQYVLYISNSSTAARLHHRVRKLTGILGSFDLLHHTMGAVFGLNKVYTVDLACNASIQVLEASWIVLNASRAVLEASWSPGGVLEPSWSPLGWGLGVSHQI